MPVSVVSRARRRGCRAGDVAATARRALTALGEGASEVTVVLVDDEAMRELNRVHRGVEAPTDVLAFAMREGRRSPGDERLLGDVVISLDTAARQAAERRVPLDAEVRALLVHGLLHLLGYDHERSAAEARRMFARARWLERALA